MSRKDVIIKRIKGLANEKYPDSEIYLYGSRARGDDKASSDWDLLILLNAKNIPFEVETNLMDEFYELELEIGEIIAPLVYSKSDWFKKYYMTSLFENIQKDSIRIK